jgi:hypothetical protein
LDQGVAQKQEEQEDHNKRHYCGRTLALSREDGRQDAGADSNDVTACSTWRNYEDEQCYTDAKTEEETLRLVLKRPTEPLPVLFHP